MTISRINQSFTYTDRFNLIALLAFISVYLFDEIWRDRYNTNVSVKNKIVYIIMFL